MNRYYLMEVKAVCNYVIGAINHNMLCPVRKYLIHGVDFHQFQRRIVSQTVHCSRLCERRCWNQGIWHRPLQQKLQVIVYLLTTWYSATLFTGPIKLKHSLSILHFVFPTRLPWSHMTFWLLFSLLRFSRWTTCLYFCLKRFSPVIYFALYISSREIYLGANRHISSSSKGPSYLYSSIVYFVQSKP